jgi:putative tryptophan/tyrosine transport system substrate-binding protein
MTKRTLVGLLTTLFLTIVSYGEAQQAGVRRVGVIMQGGPYYEAIDGLRDGLRKLGLQESKDFILEIRDAKGDLKLAEESARQLEREKVDLIYTLATSVTKAVKQATTEIPIVFYAGNDPVALGLVESFAHPGGRLTGIHFRVGDLTGKRLEILKEIYPKLHRVVTFYDPSSSVSLEAAKFGRDAANQMGIELLERHVASVQELRSALGALKRGEIDAYAYTSDAMVGSQAQLIIDTAKAKGFATMYHEGGLVTDGALASYGISYYGAGLTSAKYVQRILAGIKPKDLPVETVDKIELVINLKTARQIGITIPQRVLTKADKVIK